MRVTFLAFAALVATACALDLDKPVHDKKLIETVNNANAGWEAAPQPVFDGVTWAEAQGLCGTKLRGPTDDSRIANYDGYDMSSLPTSFDARVQWPDCVHAVLNQGQCGSCWAFGGSSEALSDRNCIAGGTNVVLSPQELVSCDHFLANHGCSGGILEAAWDYMEESGLVSIDCMPYTSGNGQDGTCSHECVPPPASPSTYYYPYNSVGNDTSYTKTKAKLLSGKYLMSAENIQASLLADGPVSTAFDVYEDFMSYQSGVYRHTTGGYVGGHAVKIVGWGVADGSSGTYSGEPYWIVQNSWSTNWGLDGFFWFLRGQNECHIETGAFVGEADA